MKKILFSLIAVALLAMSVASCDNGETARLQAQVDSLQQALGQSGTDYNQLNEFLTVVAAGLDSISAQESDIFNPGNESPTPNREQIKKNLSTFKDLLKTQRERIAQLENQLKNAKGDGVKLRTIISTLRTQLEEKEARIAQLEKEMAGKDMSIQELSMRVGTLIQKAEDQSMVIQSQSQTLQEQDRQLNEAFIRIGTKVELKAAGLLSGGFLRKKKVDYANLDRSQFQTVDIRRVGDIDIPSKRPKVLTPVPVDSYTIETNGDTSTLHIVDPTRFWSVSSFLIIQI